MLNKNKELEKLIDSTCDQIENIINPSVDPPLTNRQWVDVHYLIEKLSIAAYDCGKTDGYDEGHSDGEHMGANKANFERTLIHQSI